jgi:hypothetical protein
MLTAKLDQLTHADLRGYTHGQWARVYRNALRRVE